MINKVNLALYNEVARMKNTLNNYIRQAQYTKTQMNKKLLPSSSIQLAGIGRKVDLLA